MRRYRANRRAPKSEWLQSGAGIALCCFLLVGPPPAAAQPQPSQSAALFEMLGGPTVDSLTQVLGERFAQDFLLLVPDLPADERAFFISSLAEVFDGETLRSEVDAALTAAVTSTDLERLMEMGRAGPLAELTTAAEGAPPSPATNIDVGQLGDEDLARLQLMASLVAAQGRADLDLILNEEVTRAVHGLVNALGGGLGPFQPLSDEDFNSSYRQRTLALAIEGLQRYEGVADDVVRVAINLYDDPAWLSISDARIEALANAISAAGQRVFELTAPVDESEAAPAPELDELSPGMPCRANVCGYIVEWSGPAPTAPNRRFGAGYEIDRRVLVHLAGAGYRLKEGRMEGGMTIRLAPRLTRGNCAVSSGTSDTACAAIDQVRIDFLGTPPGRENMDPITVRNRCGANSIMGVEGISAYVAIHLDLALTTFEGDERKPPNC